METLILKVGVLIHLSKFRKGVSHLTTTTMLERFPLAKKYGGKELFVAPKAEIDVLLKQGLTRKEIMVKLGIENEAFLTGKLVRIDIFPKGISKLKMPTGTESGANSLFKFGGKTSGNVSEATVESVSKSSNYVRKTTFYEK